MLTRISLALFALCACALAQDPFVFPPVPGEDALAKAIEVYGLAGRERLYTPDEVRIVSLSPLLPWLEKRLRPTRPLPAGTEPLLRLSGKFREVFSENGGAVIEAAPVDLEVSLAPSLDGGARLMFEYLGSIPAIFRKGSVSGTPLGDACARYLDRPHASLALVRKNAFVRIHCSPRSDFSEPKNRPRPLPDPGLPLRCEQLARDIDAELLKLPSRAALPPSEPPRPPAP